MTGAATIVIEPGYLGYLGPAMSLRPHTTPVTCLAVGLDTPLEISTSTDTVSARSILSPARVEHRCDVKSGRMLCLFIDPLLATPAANRSRVSAWTGQLGANHRAEDDLIELVTMDNIEWAHVVSTAFDVTNPIPDQRVIQALNHVHNSPGTSAEDLAHKVGLSRSHFLTLFASHSHTSLRRYRQWVRVRHAAAGAASGYDLTRCAADAGFASPSHLSRCATSMSGVNPSQLLQMNLHFQTTPTPTHAL